MRWAALALIAIHAGSAQEVSGERMRAHVQLLSHDALEGRAPGNRGGDLATLYIASQLAVAGAKAGGLNDDWYQPVPLTGVSTQPSSRLNFSGPRGKLDLGWLNDFVGQTQLRTSPESLDADVVFAGHGITAPEFNWDDYRDVDVKGKVVVLFTNEPPSTDANFFGGAALTYYGRWSYKFEEAARRGAAAALILHTRATAGYGWEVVRNSWGREDDQADAGGLGLAGWLQQDAAAKLLALASRQTDALLKMADTRGFRAFPLGIRMKGDIVTRFRPIATRNVAGMVRGSDPDLAHEAVVFTAHWDHLGMDSQAAGDGIYNGAVDNATGCAILLEIAHAWAAFELRPRRSALFLFTTAEEAGLRGSQYYVAHPLIPLESTTLELNLDAFFPFGRTSDMITNGAERTSFWTQIQGVAQRYQLSISPDPQPGQGTFFRSDHFPFFQSGVPAFSISQGTSFLADGDRKRSLLAEYDERRYHRPADEYSDRWDFSGMEDVAKFAAAVGQAAANADRRVVLMGN